MNQQQYSVLFYSQYSSNCKKMTDILHNYAIPIQEVCVDNEKIRKQILTSKNIKIENVPCILIAYADGGIELFTGSNAFGWLEDVISKILPPSPVITNDELPYTSIPLTIIINKERIKRNNYILTSGFGVGASISNLIFNLKRDAKLLNLIQI